MARPVVSAMTTSELLYTQSFSENPISDPIIHGTLGGAGVMTAWQGLGQNLYLEPGTSWRSPFFAIDPLGYVRLSFRAKLKTGETSSGLTSSLYNQNHLRFISNNPAATWNLDPLTAGPSGGDLIADDVTSLINLSEQWTEQVFYSRAQANAVRASIELTATDSGYLIDDIRVESVSDRKDVSAWADGIWIQRFYSSGLAQSPEINGFISSEQQSRLVRTLSKLQAGQPVRIVLCGDSIVNDLANSALDVLLERAFPGASVSVITAVGGGTGMDQWNPLNSMYPFISNTSYRGALKFNEAIIDQKPDLVILGGISTPANQSGYAAFQDIVSKLRSESVVSYLGYQPDILIATGAFGSVAKSWNPSLQLTATQGDYRGSLLRIANANNIGFWDLTGAWGEYLLAALNGSDPLAVDHSLSRQHYWRDNIHANTYGKQILGRALTEYLVSAQSAGLDLPVVSLTVATEAVAEDGDAAMNFTFSRTGSTAAPLKVFFRVGGTAVSGSDYAGIEGTGNVFSIDIPSGSMSATLMIKPVADSLQEPDETVVFVLDSLSGSGYTIATDTPVVGVIKNDDSKMVTIALVHDNVGTLQGPIAEGAVSNDTTPTLSGSLSAPLAKGERVAIFRNGSLAGYARVSSAAWSFTPSRAIGPSGMQTFTAAVVDAAGSVGPLSPARNFILDTSAPGQTVSITDVIDDTDPVQGSVAARGRTNDATPTLLGSLSSPLGVGETLRIYNGATFLSEAVVAPGSLAWSATPTLAFNGNYRLNARVMDAAGNQGTASANRLLTLDTIAPKSSATITSIHDNVGTVQGSIGEGATSNDSTPTLSGSISAALAKDERLSIFRNGSLAGYARVTGTSWSFTPSSPIGASGLQSFTAAVVDGAGNLGASSPPRSFSFNPSAESTWTYNWASASTLGSTPGVLLARVSLPSPRQGEPSLKVTALRVDLSTPGLRLTATGRSPDWQANTRETLSATTRGFVTANQQAGIPVVAAINTAFFWLTDASRSVPTNLAGLAVSDGVLVSPAENDFAALLIDPITGARIEQITNTSFPDPANLTLAVSGGQSVAGMVLRNGLPSGDIITQNARSALGLSQDGRYLTLLTVDRSLRDLTPSYYGATLWDVGTILAGMGSHTGMNLDGGGSTAMAWWNPTTGSSELLNAPLGGVERFVGSNLGVVFQPVVETSG